MLCTFKVELLKLLSMNFDLSLLFHRCVNLNIIKIKYEMKI